MEGEICLQSSLLLLRSVRFYLQVNTCFVFISISFLNVFLLHFADLKIKNVNLEESKNLERHRTEGFSGSKTLVVRRGVPIRVSVQLEGRAFDPRTDTLRIKVMLGSLRSDFSGMNGSWDPNLTSLRCLSALPRPPVRGHAGHFLQEGFSPLLDGLH